MFSRKSESDFLGNRGADKRFYKKGWFRFLALFILIIVAAGGIFLWKAGSMINKISGKSGIFKNLVNMVPGVEQKMKGEEEGRINILLLGMRGENVIGGGLLADTIMLVSIKPAENKAAFLSIPRDLHVTVPGTSDKQKINAVHYYGEQKGKGGGLEAMKQVVGEITGLPVHYAASINFKGFTELVDSLGGVEITLDKPFEESMQFQEPHVCDPYVFTVPTGKYQYKYGVKSGKIVAQYPLCVNKNPECGGNFKIPAGTSTLDGNKALCYARSRFQSSDFERAKRQQIIIQKIKDKALSAGTLTNFEKINGMFNALGDNVRTDMEIWEMKRAFDLYQKAGNPEIVQRVLEDSEEGLLYHPPTEKETGYILLPIGNNYDKIRELAQNIFIAAPQSDIKPK